MPLAAVVTSQMSRRFSRGGGRDKHTHTHINTMTRPGVGAGQSEKKAYKLEALKLPP